MVNSCGKIGINDDGMMAPLYFGIMKVIFLHVIDPNICLQAEEKAQAQRNEQTRGAEEAKTANAGKQVLLSISKLVVHRCNQQ